MNGQRGTMHLSPLSSMDRMFVSKKASLKHRNGRTAHNESIRMSRENVDDCRLEDRCARWWWWQEGEDVAGNDSERVYREVQRQSRLPLRLARNVKSGIL